jgi:hypothetical protein
MSKRTSIGGVWLDDLDFEIYHFRDSADTSSKDVVALSEDIGANGQLQGALVVEPFTGSLYKYNLVIGHRRYLALLGIEERTGVRQKLECDIKTPRDEAEAIGWAISENQARKNFEISELCKLEVRLRDMMLSRGLVVANKKAKQKEGDKTYNEYRAAIEGVTTRTIEKRLSIGEAVPLLHEAVDAKYLSFNSASSLAVFDAATQTHVIQYLYENSIAAKRPDEIAAIANAIRMRQGMPVIKHGKDYLPSDYTLDFGEHINRMERLMGMTKMCLDYYSMGNNDKGLRARRVLEAIELVKALGDETALAKAVTGKYPEPKRIAKGDKK